jgi:hypothetical protein
MKHELSKYDFAAIEAVFDFATKAGLVNARCESLRKLFATAHTGWLELDPATNEEV